MPTPVNRSCSTATAESTWWTPSPPALRTASVSLRTASAATDTSTAATTKRECRSGSRIRTGAGAVTIRRQITASAGLGHDLTTQVDELRAHGSRVETIFPDSNSEHMSAPMRWICRCARPPLELVTTKAEPLPSSSPNSGADAYGPVDSVGVTTPAHASDGRWPMADGRDAPHATFVRPDLGSFCRLNELGLQVVGQRLEARSCGVCLPGRRDRRVRPVVPAAARSCPSSVRPPCTWLTLRRTSARPGGVDDDLGHTARR